MVGRQQPMQAEMDEPLQAGHSQPTLCPWNTPICVIKKKSGHWRLVQDLRAVNCVNEPMGALQPGLPCTAVPLGYHLIVIDLKDCFFSLPFHPEDCKRFAFSVLAINFKELVKRYCCLRECVTALPYVKICGTGHHACEGEIP